VSGPGASVLGCRPLPSPRVRLVRERGKGGQPEGATRCGGARRGGSAAPWMPDCDGQRKRSISCLAWEKKPWPSVPGGRTPLSSPGRSAARGPVPRRAAGGLRVKLCSGLRGRGWRLESQPCPKTGWWAGGTCGVAWALPFGSASSPVARGKGADRRVSLTALVLMPASRRGQFTRPAGTGRAGGEGARAAGGGERPLAFPRQQPPARGGWRAEGRWAQWLRARRSPPSGQRPRDVRGYSGDAAGPGVPRPARGCRCAPGAPARDGLAARPGPARRGKSVTGPDGKNPMFSWHSVTEISAMSLENGIPCVYKGTPFP